MRSATETFYRLTSTSLGAGLFMGTAFGTLMGLEIGLDTRSVAVGVVGGFGGGVFFGTFMVIAGVRFPPCVGFRPVTEPP